jgi:hypothetical protein
VSFRDIILGALSLALLAGCGALPKPFAHSGANLANPLLRLADGGGVQVAAAPGLFEGIARPLLAAAVKGLGAANVPATSNPDVAGAFRLTGDVSIEIGNPGDAETARFIWRLQDADGTEVGAFDQTITGDAPGWLTEDRKMYEIIAADAGQRIAGILRGTEAAAGPAGPSAALGPSLYLVGVDGAPGDGNLALVRSLRLVVARGGGQVSDNLDSATHLVMGSVAVSEPKADSQLLVVSWAVTGLDGIELGKVTQSNRVPVTLTAGRWGGLAYAIAQGAGEGIFDILERAKIVPARRKALQIPDLKN